MAIVFMTDPNTGRCALYDENGTAGNPDDPNSVRNAPLNNPAQHLDKIYFHSDFLYGEVALSGSITIGHPAIAAGSTAGANANVVFGGAPATHVLANHNLGIVPMAMVSLGSNVITPGYPIYAGSNSWRFVTAYCTASQLLLHENALRSGAAGGQSVTYDYLIFRDEPQAVSTHLIDWNTSTEVVKMGLGKFDSSKRYLQVVAGGTPYFFPMGRTGDLSNGAMRIVDAVGNVFDPVLSGLAYRIIPPSSSSFGASMSYNGAFAGGPVIQVKAP